MLTLNTSEALANLEVCADFLIIQLKLTLAVVCHNPGTPRKSNRNLQESPIRISKHITHSTATALIPQAGSTYQTNRGRSSDLRPRPQLRFSILEYVRLPHSEQLLFTTVGLLIQLFYSDFLGPKCLHQSYTPS
jgi:hypothetical protein